MVRWFPSHLLRRHIAHCAQDYTRLGLELHRRGFGLGLDAECTERVCQLCKSEVEYLDMPVLGDKEILWFYVAVNDSARMGRGQSTRNLQHVIDRLSQR